MGIRDNKSQTRSPQQQRQERHQGSEATDGKVKVDNLPLPSTVGHIEPMPTARTIYTSTSAPIVSSSPSKSNLTRGAGWNSNMGAGAGLGMAHDGKGKQKSVPATIKDALWRKWIWTSGHLGLGVMEPWEQALTLIFVFVLLLLFSIALFQLPSYARFASRRLFFYITGDDGVHGSSSGSGFGSGSYYQKSAVVRQLSGLSYTIARASAPIGQIVSPSSWRSEEL